MQAQGNFVVVEAEPVYSENKYGIKLPDEPSKTKGKVVSIGEHSYVDAKEGTTIVFRIGMPFEVDGKSFLAVNDEDVIAIL